jgi:hypothetical protein
MKGVVFNLLEQAVTDAHGADAWMDLIDAAGVDGTYTSLGSYPDEEMFALVGAASAALNLPPEAILRWFGQKAMPMLAVKYGAFFEGHRNAESFVLSVNDIIHPEVRKLYSGAGCPHFHFTHEPDGQLIVGYHSPRKLCHLAQGFIEGASAHFGQSVEVAHLACMADGNPICRLGVRWAA